MQNQATKINFGELRLGSTAKRHLQECIDSNWLTLGPKTTQYEQAFPKLFNYKYGVAVNSGTSGCMAACMALYDLKYAFPGAGIIVPALSFIATSNAVRAAGFTPIWVDVDLQSMNIDPDLVRKTIANTKIPIVAILAVNTMGKPCNMSALLDICKDHGIVLISDACESYGCQHNHKFMLDYAAMEIISTYTAHIICTTEGGMVFTNDEDTNFYLRSIRSHGREPDSVYFQHDRFGLNFKPTDMTSAIGLEGVEQFWAVFYERKSNFTYLYKSLDFLKKIAWFVEQNPEDINCAHAFSIVLKEPWKQLIDPLKNILTEKGIAWKRNFGCIPTQHTSFNRCLESKKYQQLSYPNSEYLGNFGIHIGCHQYLTAEDLDYVVAVFKDFWQQNK